MPADELKICKDDIAAEAASFTLNDALFMKRSARAEPPGAGFHKAQRNSINCDYSVKSSPGPCH